MVMHACTWSCITIATYVCHFCLGTKVPRHNAGITYDGGGGGTYVLIVAHCHPCNTLCACEFQAEQRMDKETARKQPTETAEMRIHD